jgi:hypothetical protein
MKIIFSILLLLPLVFCGCLNSENAVIYCDGISIKLFPPTKSSPATINEQNISKQLSKSDIKAIASLIGRIPNVSHEIEGLNVIATDPAVSVKLWIHGYEIDCGKNSHGKWLITRMVRCAF